MSTGAAFVAISAANSAQAAAANAAAQEAAREACKAMIRGYQNDTATVESARQYASCIGRLYPEPMTDVETVWMKIAIFIIIASLFAGIVYGWRRDSYDKALGAVVFGFLFPCSVACAGFILAGIVFGIKFILS